MELNIVNLSDVRIPRAFLEEWVGRMVWLARRHVPAKKFMNREMTIAFLNEKDAREMNEKYRGKDYATDVLSFAAKELDPWRTTLGDLVICPQVIARQAREHGLTIKEELGYMVIHGFLHLCGHDHEKSPRRAKKMFAIQDDLFERLCVAHGFAKKKNKSEEK